MERHSNPCLPAQKFVLDPIVTRELLRLLAGTKAQSLVTTFGLSSCIETTLQHLELSRQRSKLAQ
jgi:hypothetical protein